MSASVDAPDTVQPNDDASKTAHDSPTASEETPQSEATAEPAPEADSAEVEIAHVPERVALLTPGGPLIVDVWLTIDGEPHTAALTAMVDHVLKAADTDGDGRATWKELVANRDYLGEAMPSAPAADSRQMTTLIDRYDENRDGQVQRGEAAAWLGRDAGVTATPFAVRSSRTYRPVPHAASQIWQLLDLDKNGRLSTEEIRRASAALLSLDDDDDWIIAPRELVSLREQLEAAAPRRVAANFQTTHYAAIQLDAKTELERLDYLLSDLYAAGQPLAPQSFPELSDLFNQLDADGDGWLAADELAQLQTIEPHIELSVAFAAAAGTGTPIASIELKQHAPQVIVAAQPAADRVVLSLGATRLIVSAHELTPRQNNEQSADQTVQQSLGRSQIRLMVHDQCDALFEALDENADGRLGEREVSGCVERLEEWDLNQDGELTSSELPYCMIVAFLLGERLAEQSFYVPASSATAAQSEPPAWFLHADLNGDGEISRREFLGPFEQFYTLDTDGNGYINAAEAAAFESRD